MYKTLSYSLLARQEQKTKKVKNSFIFSKFGVLSSLNGVTNATAEPVNIIYISPFLYIQYSYFNSLNLRTNVTFN